MKISELCNQVLSYLLTIPISNKSATYTPSGYLVNGATLKTFTTQVQWSPSASLSSVISYANVTQTIKTSETIPSAYTAQATDTRITNDWNTFKDAFVSDLFNGDETLSLSSIFLFIYLVRCFIDTRFILVTDVYHKSYVWLYNTNTSVDYKVDSNIKVTNFTKSNGVSNLNSIISALAAEIANRRSFYILKSTTYAAVTNL